MSYGRFYHGMTNSEFNSVLRQVVEETRKEKEMSTNNPNTPTLPSIQRMSRHTLIKRLRSALNCENTDDFKYEVGDILSALEKEVAISDFVRQMRDGAKPGTAIRRAAVRALKETYRY